jgi:hypothetical protein
VTITGNVISVQVCPKGDISREDKAGDNEELPNMHDDGKY